MINTSQRDVATTSYFKVAHYRNPLVLPDYCIKLTEHMSVFRIYMIRGLNMYGRMALATAILSLSGLSVTADTTTAPPDWEAVLERHDQEIGVLKDKIEGLETQDAPAGTGQGLQWTDRIIFSGRGAAAFYSSEDQGAYPNDEFRIDEARLRLEVKLDEDAYLFTEVNLADHDDDREETWLGDLYVDLENISRFWNADLPLNLRIGRFDIPYGEEYQHRDAIDNPLITHSLTDYWGIDEGIALFGAAGKWDYIAAVQNGGHPFFHDYNSDKAIILRLGLNPNKNWRFSFSAMRTGDIDSIEDETSEIWYGNCFFRGIGDAATNGTFGVELVELNIRYRWDSGHIAAAGGFTWYDDDSAGDNEHDSDYISLEVVQDVTERWFAASRFSWINSDEGMPIVGLGPFYPDFFNDDLVTEIWRLSLGAGFKFSKNLIAKAEYSFEEGDRQSGEKIEDRNMLSAQLAFSF